MKVTPSSASAAAAEPLRRALESIFRASDDALGVLRVELDKSGRVRDFVVLEANPRFEQYAGTPLVGKSPKDVPLLAAELWPGLLADVALGQQAVRVSMAGPQPGCWFDVEVFPAGEPRDRLVGVRLRDITQQRRREARLQAVRRIRTVGLMVWDADLKLAVLSNATKYTPAGGLIRVAADADDKIVRVRIHDSAIGIAREHQARVFELFSQVRDHQEHSQGGLGIGLALVHSLLQLHGGSITVHSEGTGRADAMETLANLLRADGHEVATAANGAEAVELAMDFNPDVALIDLGMPVMDGFEAARQIRMRAAGKNMRLVALTGWGQPADRQRTTDAGFDLHLVKPLTPEGLSEALAGAPQEPDFFTSTGGS